MTTNPAPQEARHVDGAGGGEKAWTTGPWAVHHHWPTYIVPADHAERPCGGAEDDAEDLRRFAQDVACTGFSARHRTKAEVLANAHLIAAAPALYDALEAARELLAMGGWERAAEQVDAALASARGEQP